MPRSASEAAVNRVLLERRKCRERVAFSGRERAGEGREGVIDNYVKGAKCFLGREQEAVR